MEVILIKDVEKLGKKGEVVQVRDGYGRNFLLPQSLALPASRANRALIEAERKRLAVRKAREKGEAEKLAQKIQSLKIPIEVTVGEKDKLFGSVTAQDLAEALAREGVTLDKKQVRLSEPLKTLGAHTVILDLEADVKATLQVEIVKKKD